MLGFEFRRKGLNNRLADVGLRAGGEEDVSGDGETSDDESICWSEGLSLCKSLGAGMADGAKPETSWLETGSSIEIVSKYKKLKKIQKIGVSVEEVIYQGVMMHGDVGVSFCARKTLQWLYNPKHYFIIVQNKISRPTRIKGLNE